MAPNKDRSHIIKFLCTVDGQITRLVKDQDNFFGEMVAELRPDQLFSDGDAYKFRQFIGKIITEGNSFVKKIEFLGQEAKSTTFCLFGLLDDRAISVLAVQTSGSMENAMAELMTMYSEQGRLLRVAQKNAMQITAEPSEILDTYVQTNNDLAKLHRELHKKNYLLEQAYQKIERISKIDSLTLLFNRHHFTEKSQEEMNRCKRYDLNSCMLFLDIDLFKSINDDFGHAAGDYVLFRFAEICSDQLRENDLFGRIGGEEFCIYLLHTPIEKAELIAERIRQAIEEETFTFEGASFNITVSIGVAEFDKEESYDTLMSRADKALYRAKKEGRNRVCVQ